MNRNLSRPALEDIERDIFNLNSAQLLLCGLVVCERLLPNYKAFSDQVTWGDTPYLRSVIDHVWGVVGAEIDLPSTENLLNQTSALIPDSDDFPGPIAGLAQYAAAALCHLLESMKSNGIEHIAQIRILALDSVDAYIQVTSGSSQQLIVREDFVSEWERIDNDPLMQAEIKRQKNEIEQISALKAIDREIVFRLKAENESSVLFDVSTLVPRPPV